MTIESVRPLLPIQSTCGHLLRTGHLLAQNCFDHHFEASKLSSVQFGALQTIAQHTGLSHQELSIKMRTAASVMTTALKPLSARKLIARHAAANDGRALVYSLTPAGIKLLKSCEPNLQACEQALMQTLSPAERDQLKVLLNKLAPPDDNPVQTSKSGQSIDAG